MNSKLKEFFLMLGQWCMILFVCGGLAVGCISGLGGKTCEASWANSGFESRWGFWTNCQIKVNGNWLPAASYANIELQNRSRSIPHTP